MDLSKNKVDLFNRLPERVFSPLASTNKHLYWGVLSKLYNDFFAEDVVLVGLGTPKQEILESIDRYMMELPQYINEQDETTGSVMEQKQLNYRVYYYLVKTGWLSVEQENYADYIVLEPMVAQLLAYLTDIAVQDPVYFGGKVQSIYNDVVRAYEQPEDQALAFNLTAKSARDFARSLNAIVIRIRDINGGITGETSTKDALKSFFDDFVSGILIADYKNLKTVNHPFRYRFNILEKAQSIHLDDELRARFIVGYATQMDIEEEAAELRFEKDIATIISVFSNVERQLQRIDDIKYKLESRMNNMVRFMEKSAGDITLDIEALISTLSSGDAHKIRVPILPGELMSEERLYKPRAESSPAKATVLARTPTPYSLIAEERLSREARHRRNVTSNTLIKYTERHMMVARAISSDQLTIHSVEDYCAFVTLTHISLNPEHFTREWPEFLKRYDAKTSPTVMTENDYLSTPQIIITRKGGK